MELIQNMQIKDSTKKCYTSDFNKLEGLGIKYDCDEQELITKLSNITPKNERFKKTVNIVYCLRKASGLSTDLINSYKTSYNIINVRKQTDANIGLADFIPTIEDLYNFLEQQWIIKRYDWYVINYLLIHLQCRNLDLELTIINDESQMNKSDNFLIIKENTVEFVRNNYKTVMSYGPKKNIITCHKFLKCCQELIKTNPQLLRGSKNIANYIINRTYDRVGQTVYTKVIMNNSDVKDINQISCNRGTSTSTLLNFYDINKVETTNQI